jgi:hypothetical protein
MQDHSDAAFSTALSARIAKPSRDCPPLRANAYEFAALANTTLAPLFPYVHRGAIVPTISLIVGGSGSAGYGHFFHENTEEEVAVVFADRNAVKGKGTVMIAPMLHGVQAFLKDESDPESYMLITITQRQRDAGEQSERVFFRCGCNNVLYEFSYDATPPETHDPHHHDIFMSIANSSVAGVEFNQDESRRTCAKCGKVNPPFPHEAWGWVRHARWHDVTADARG